MRLIESGCDMVMVCAHFTDSGRARGFAGAIAAAINEGRLDLDILARSKARVESLLSRAATNEVHQLPESTFRAHAAGNLKSRDRRGGLRSCSDHRQAPRQARSGPAAASGNSAPSPHHKPPDVRGALSVRLWNCTKMFHVKHFGTIDAENRTVR